MEDSRLQSVHFQTKLASPREPLIGRVSCSSCLGGAFGRGRKAYGGVDTDPVGVLLVAR